ncbi:hypothetical protein BX616_005671 [Lobosporangium transversale]|uniref:BZIP domain-containing protein n=1 Tax=Lobosporangium transversale TaxID=64571 RepID=A0A1Y2GR99_9FUNG|nr:hypothetical protein BCR41DRAFT_351120 [Lobosporangium transversale]KAF9897396.1 hypothetical protein BX616_005671 [Lobosporangium transversale]ORZ20012.1 hypothetical protein BCR41DRAFT_351120 [Lobosporangium transversale]|eukprot:XP_021882552.1 hypothetical protein BCR41DRAFT_351120 [Lobosporangium transversale]
MSIETDIRRDANPTPTRFLLECGAFTPGFGLSLENYNPFDASMKIFNTGTPKAELNPFDSSFVVPSSLNNKPGMLQSDNQKNNHTERHSWGNTFDDAAMPMPQMSPGLSPSSSSASSSPSPPIQSPPPQTISLSDFHVSMPFDHDSRTFTYDHPIFEPLPQKKQYSSVPRYEYPSRASSSSPIRETLAPNEILNDHQTVPQAETRLFEDEDGGNYSERSHDVEEHDEHDQELGAAMSALDMRRYSVMSDIQQSVVEESSIAQNKTSKALRAASKAKKSSPTAAADGGNARKAKSTATKSRKRSSMEEESPELKRQRFLERNRMAASKCREKKRLQTLKTISDADEITARNQALHETLDQLQEEVRRLKNQILCHRDCGCDVIQKFVRTSLDFSSPAMVAVPPTMPYGMPVAPVSSMQPY